MAPPSFPKRALHELLLRDSMAITHSALMKKVVGAALFACVLHISAVAMATPDEAGEAQETKAGEAKVAEPSAAEPKPVEPKGVESKARAVAPDATEEPSAAPSKPPSVLRTLILDNLFGVSTSTAGTYVLAPFSLAAPSGRSPDFFFLGDVQFHLLDVLTIGVKGAVSIEQILNTSAAYATYMTRRAFYVLARLGLYTRISDRLAFWPNIGIGPTIDYSEGRGSTATGLLVEGEAAFVYGLTKNVFFAGAPAVRGRVGRLNDGLGLGLNVRLGLTF